MMQHTGLAEGRWAAMPLCEQMAHIGSEVYRTAKWQRKGNDAQARKAFDRALELMDLTLRYGRLQDRQEDRDALLREVCRLREIFCRAYLEEGPEAVAALNPYFDAFAFAARNGRAS